MSAPVRILELSNGWRFAIAQRNTPGLPICELSVNNHDDSETTKGSFCANDITRLGQWLLENGRIGEQILAHTRALERLGTPAVAHVGIGPADDEMRKYYLDAIARRAP